MSQPVFVPGTRDIWYTDAASGFYSLRLECPRPTGSLSGRALGPIHLGQLRLVARSKFLYYDTRGRRYWDFFCPDRRGIRAAYGSPKLLRSLKPAERRRVRGRIVIALTSNRNFTLRGVRPGTPLGLAVRTLRLGQGIKLGSNTWYVIPMKRANGLLKAAHGVVQEVGPADKRLSRNRKAATALLTSFA
jgi:hypothetical protein